jgi:succinyl-diaminopimelate desuccinylase
MHRRSRQPVTQSRNRHRAIAPLARLGKDGVMIHDQPLIDAVALTRDLIRLDTVNPPGHEARAQGLLAEVLAGHGFAVHWQRFGDDRANLVATHGLDSRPPFAFTGHVDTVPLGDAPWSTDPWGGAEQDGRMYGRGASDMKSGVAAMVAAAVALKGVTPLVLLITAGEEIGSEGALRLRDGGPSFPKPAALVVAEPTANRLAHGHKGALFMTATASGKTAHSSMPQEGINALTRLARAILSVDAFRFATPAHPVLGAPTVSVNLAQGGHAPNAVPAQAQLTMDARTIPAQTHEQVLAELQAVIGADIPVRALFDLPAVWTDPADPLSRAAAEAIAAATGSNSPPLGMPYFTDASVFTPWLGCPTLVLGPGEPTQAHKTDEWVEVARIPQAVRLYVDMVRRWATA